MQRILAIVITVILVSILVIAGYIWLKQDDYKMEVQKLLSRYISSPTKAQWELFPTPKLSIRDAELVNILPKQDGVKLYATNVTILSDIWSLFAGDDIIKNITVNDFDISLNQWADLLTLQNNKKISNLTFNINQGKIKVGKQVYAINYGKIDIKNNGETILGDIEYMLDGKAHIIALEIYRSKNTTQFTLDGQNKSISGKITYDKGEVTAISDLKIQSNDYNFIGNIVIDENNVNARFVTKKMVLDNVNYDFSLNHSYNLLEKIFDWLEVRNLRLQIESASSYLRDESIGKITIDMLMKGGSRTVKYFRIDNHAAKLLLKNFTHYMDNYSGRLLLRSDNDRRFINLLLENESLSTLAKILFTNEEVQNFGLSSNIILSAQELKAPNLKAVFGESQINSNTTLYFGQKNELVGDISINQLDMSNNTTSLDFFQAQSDAYAEYKLFDYLRKLNERFYNIELKINLENLQFKNDAIKDIKFSFISKKGKNYIRDIEFYHNVIADKNRFFGDIEIDIGRYLPHVELFVKIPNFNLNKTLHVLNLLESSEDTYDWSQDKISLDFLDSFTAKAIFNIGDFTINKLPIKDATLEMAVADSKIDIKKMAATIHEKTFSINGYILGGKIPRSELSISLQDGKLADYLGKFYDIKKVDGLFSAQGKISLTGNTAHDLVNSLKGQIKFIFRNVIIAGYSVEKLNEMLPKVKSRNKIAQLANFTLSRGKNLIDYFTGKLVFSEGVAHINNWQFSTKSHKASLSGKVDLSSDKMQLRYRIDIPKGFNSTLSLEQNIWGDIKSPKTHWNIDSLYNHWEQQHYGQ